MERPDDRDADPSDAKERQTGDVRDHERRTDGDHGGGGVRPCRGDDAAAADGALCSVTGVSLDPHSLMVSNGYPQPVATFEPPEAWPRRGRRPIVSRRGRVNVRTTSHGEEQTIGM